MHRRLLILVAVLGLGVTVAGAQTPTEPQISPKEVVEQFYKMQTEGRWLGPERWDELQDFLTESGPWYPPETIFVLKSYQVGEARRSVGYEGREDYSVEVDYFKWGSIDSFLNFEKTQLPKGKNSPIGEPVEERRYETLHLTDSFVKRSLSADEKKTVALKWRMYLAALPNSVDVDTAVRWMAAVRDKSNDPAIKYNAERTLATLRSLSAGAPVPVQHAGPVQKSPTEVAQRFIELESALMPTQWSQLAKFFVETPKPRWNKAHIVDVVDTSVSTGGDSIEVQVSTNSLGDLDSSLRLSNYPTMRLPLVTPSSSACYGDDRFGFNLLLSDKHWEIAADGTAKEHNGPLAWRIEDTSFEPLITLDTAIRYLRQVSDRTTDPAIKTNAVRTLSILKYYKQGKPLPDELSSDANSGCG